MSSDEPTEVAIARPTVFLSYATQDRPAARALQQALSSFDLEVWLDESELGGGEAWDQKIRQQIRECQFFMPVVSAQTEARVEGYFRREWRLAVERSLDMADDHLFLLPVVIDGTDQTKARVPEKFLAVQWLRLPEGRSTPALEALCRRITSGQPAATAPTRKAAAKAKKAAARTVPDFPPFPAQTLGQKPPYWLAVIVWGARTAAAGFLRLPRWARLLAYVWMGIAVLSRLGEPDHGGAADLPPEKIEKIKSIAESYEGSSKKSDIAKLGEQVAREFVKDVVATTNPLLAIPFTVPAADSAAAKLADSTFAMLYGRIALARHGHVALGAAALPAATLAAALERGRAEHAAYVLFGTIDNPGTGPVMDIKIATVEDKSVLWTKSYALTGADAGKIATEVESKVPSLEE
jgi:hypothetical protein